jgi:hypothetical protein
LNQGERSLASGASEEAIDRGSNPASGAFADATTNETREI